MKSGVVLRGPSLRLCASTARASSRPRSRARRNRGSLMTCGIVAGAQQQPAQERGQVVRVALRRIVRHHVAHLLADHVLERRQRLERLPHRPLADLVAGDVDDFLRPVLKDPDCVSPGLGLPRGDVIDPVHGQDRTRRTHLVVEVRHRLERPEHGFAVRGQEIGRFRPRDAHEPAPRSAYSEDRAQLTVLPGKEGHEPLPHGQAVAQQRKARHHGDLLRAPGLRRRIVGRLEPFDRQAHRPADQVQILQQIDAIPDLRPLLGCQNGAEYAAGVGQRDHGDVPWIRDVVAEQHAHDPQSGFFDRLPVNSGIAPRPRYRRDEGQEPVRLGSQDAALDQAGQRGAADPVPAPGDPIEPIGRVARLTVLRDVVERRIEDIVAERRGVHEHQALEIRVDAVLEREIHQHCPGERQME